MSSPSLAASSRRSAKIGGFLCGILLCLALSGAVQVAFTGQGFGDRRAEVPLAYAPL